MTKDINKGMATGAAWMIFSKFLIRGLGMISTLILVRLLAPEDFGLIAIAMIILESLEVIGSFSFDLALIQNQNTEPHHYDTAWTLLVIQGGITAILLAISAIPVSHIFNDARLEPLMYAVALASLISGFENIGTVTFRKELKLNKEFTFLTLKKLISFVVTITAAVILGNYWALIIGILTGRIASVALSYYMHPYRPGFSLTATRELFHFSKWLLFNNILIFLNEKSDDFLVGKFTNPTELGFYTISYEISNLPTTELVYPVMRAVFPGYSKLSSDRAQLRKSFLDILSAILLFALPLAAGIAITADLMVPIFLGNKWIPSTELIQLLALFGITRVFGANTGAVYLALGKPRYVTYFTAARAIIGIPALIWAVQEAGAHGAAWVILIVSACLAPLNYMVLLRLLLMPLRDLLSAIWRPVAGAILMSLTVYWYKLFLPLPTDKLPLFEFITCVLIGAGTYIGSVLVLWYYSANPHAVEAKILNMAVRKLNSLKLRITRKDP